MAYNEFLADRIRQHLHETRVSFEDKRMMGGLVFMVNDKMCVGIIKDELMVRIDPLDFENAQTKPGCRAMDFTGKPMKGYLLVDSDEADKDESLAYWIDQAVVFNPKAKSSKKK